ncbi:MAG: hypothetical protein DMF98_13050 [Acidobacteria bacterium]|nr:MAG: hypothetical protein DMF98_13050 [Acidobacteriota bacterium]
MVDPVADFTDDVCTPGRETVIDSTFLVISGTIDEEAAIAALKAGAHDFFVKNRLSRLIPAIERALADVATRRERARTQAALRQSEARKAAVLDSVLDCIVTIDAAGNVIEFNAAAERTFGYTKIEAMGRPLADLIIPPALRHAHRAGLAHLPGHWGRTTAWKAD